jgi:hypothetical protein
MSSDPVDLYGLDGPVRRDWLERMPKVELHLHLEGAIPHGALWELICKYGGDPAVPGPDALPAQFRYRDFPDFESCWLPDDRRAALRAPVIGEAAWKA